MNINRNEDGTFQHALVQLDDMCNVTRMELTPEEQECLRSYLLRGGFMMGDDFWGDRGWENWLYEIEQVFPPEEFPRVEIPLDHEILYMP